MDDESEQKAPSAALRGWVRRARADCHMSLRELDAIADKIDNELVELPKDRDGKPIHIGDTVYAHGFPDGNGGATCEVCSIEFNEGRESSIEITTSGIVTYRAPSSLTHELPDSWERIANELDEQAGSLTKDGYTWQEDAIHDFADRIRKLAEREKA